jgi:hypothetical protein
MLRQLAATYSMLGRNGRKPVAAPRPEPLQPVASPPPDAEFNFNFDDSEFNEWNKAFITDTEAEAA